jgi:hypothetical protein
VTSGRTAKIVDRPSEFPTGSSTCLYMRNLLPENGLRCLYPGAAQMRRAVALTRQLAT